jgi:hypothetical protein
MTRDPKLGQRPLGHSVAIRDRAKPCQTPARQAGWVGRSPTRQPLRACVFLTPVNDNGESWRGESSPPFVGRTDCLLTQRR